MRESSPVMIMAFSNNPDNYLKNIERERDSIYEALLSYDDQNHLRLRKTAHISVEKLFQYVYRYRNQLSIFHFGGHANGSSLELEKKVGGNQNVQALGIAELLGTQKQLQLVFLNGCATKNQVELLLKEGVPAVIATSNLIDDLQATEFAEQFYLELGLGGTLQSAFTRAKAFIKGKTNPPLILEIEESRGIISRKNASKNEKFPWGLYFKNKKVLDWKLPKSSYDRLIFKQLPKTEKASEEINRPIVKKLFQSIRLHSKYAQKLIEEVKQERVSRNDSSYMPSEAKIRETIIKSFPPPIGTELRKLFAYELSNIQDYNRLTQVMVTYQRTIRFISLIFLSQLWEEIHMKTNKKTQATFDFLEEEKELLFQVFSNKTKNAPKIDFFKLLLQLLSFFKRNNIEPFITNDEKVWTDSQHVELLRIHHFFLEMEEELEGGFFHKQVHYFCVQAEQKLVQLLEHISIITNFNLATIKYIEHVKRRHKTSELNHVYVELNNNRIDKGRKDESYSLPEPVDTESVMIYKGHDFSTGLNLSPFIIDKHALQPRKDNSNVYLFDCFNENGHIQFIHIEHPENQLVVSSEQYSIIYDSLISAKAMLTGQAVDIHKVRQDDDLFS